MEHFDVLCIGELNVDLILTGLKQMPKVDTEIIAKNSFLTLGSSTAIFGCGVSKLGLKTSFLGKVGNDDFGTKCIDSLKEKGIHTSNIIIDKNIDTGITVALGYNNDRALVTALGSIDKLTVQDIDFSIIEKAKHIHIGSFFLQSGLRSDLVKLFKFAKERGITTSLDSGWDETNCWDYEIFEVLKYTDIFFPNENEAINIAKTKDITSAINKISKYVHTLVVKMGAKGCIVVENKQEYIGNAFNVQEVVDTTGAGDSFNAGYIYGFLNKKSIEECMAYASACGSICVQNVGGIQGCPSLEDVEKFLVERK
ncbi:MAG: carbohydrate kinase family protein [Lachnospirales bacterium]